MVQADRRSLETQVTERASRDDNFREDLISDPRGTIERELGITMPGDLNIQVLEESPNTAYVVLPPHNKPAGSELSEGDLEGLAGGWSGFEASDCSNCN